MHAVDRGNVWLMIHLYTPAVIFTGSENFRVNTYVVVNDKLLSALFQCREDYRLARDTAFVNSLVENLKGDVSTASQILVSNNLP